MFSWFYFLVCGNTSECFSQEKTDQAWTSCVWMLIIIIIIINFRDKLISWRVNECYAPEQNNHERKMNSFAADVCEGSTSKRPIEQQRRDETQFIKPIERRYDVCVLTELHRTLQRIYIVISLWIWSHLRGLQLQLRSLSAAAFLTRWNNGGRGVELHLRLRCSEEENSVKRSKLQK